MGPIFHPGRSKERLNERLRFSTFRLRCFLWVESEPKEMGPHIGFGFAADISEIGLGAYLGRWFQPGTRVRVALEDIDAPTYKGQIAWCQRYPLIPKFVAKNILDYRVGLHLRFGTEAERQRYLEYFQDLNKRVMAIKGQKVGN